MSSDFKPGTRKLIQILGWEAERFKSAEDEKYLIHRIVIEIGNRTYCTFGEERHRNEVWPVDPVLIAALRLALQEHGDRYPGDDLAFVLIRAGATDQEVIKRLHPTERLIYRWIEQGLTALDVAGVLREAEVITAVADADLARINGWISNPLTTLHRFDAILHALFDHESRLVHACVRDPGFEPHHDELLKQLLASAVPSIVIEEVSQSSSPPEKLIDVTEVTQLKMQAGDSTRTFRVGDDSQLSQEGVRVYQRDGRCVVRFKHAGKTHGFFVESKGTWMDVPSVLGGVDDFMADLGRPDRVIQFAAARGDNGEWPLFLIADPTRFEPAAERLALPFSRAS
jgi:hypothetical protein